MFKLVAAAWPWAAGHSRLLEILQLPRPNINAKDDKRSKPPL